MGMFMLVFMAVFVISLHNFSPPFYFYFPYALLQPPVPCNSVSTSWKLWIF
ncbi:Uncharacterized protein dnl_16580 [Desulfonema limicola]|uniref:Uncharacterized protein n=1 Tax=Desulfonema limicola TaxID=45656 RepID=A0A975B5W8_9BACT|nr:Uncharacterized protein dnl_16580 [Desulfonema limicola]